MGKQVLFRMSECDEKRFSELLKEKFNVKFISSESDKEILTFYDDLAQINSIKSYIWNEDFDFEPKFQRRDNGIYELVTTGMPIIEYSAFRRIYSNLNTSRIYWDTDILGEYDPLEFNQWFKKCAEIIRKNAMYIEKGGRNIYYWEDYIRSRSIKRSYWIKKDNYLCLNVGTNCVNNCKHCVRDECIPLPEADVKEITKNIYDSIENLQPTEGKYLVSQNEKYGVIDLNGNTLVSIEYDKIASDEYYNEKDEYKKSGFIVSEKTEDGFKSGYIMYNSKMLLDTKYNEIERISKEDDKNIYLIASENGKFGLYKNKKSIIPNDYQSMSYDDNNVIILQKNKKYGVASLEGKIIIPVEKESIESKGIYLYAKSANDNKVYDNQGNVVDINYNRVVYKTENDDYKISTILNNNIMYYGIIDKDGNKLVDENYRYIEYLYGNYFVATDDNGNLGVINSNGKVILDMKYSSLQKIKGKNIVQAVSKGENTSEFYSSEMKQVVSVEKPNIQTEDDYIIIINDEEKTYLDNNGNKIQDISTLKQANYPDEIGNYKKLQVTVENVYYVKK